MNEKNHIVQERPIKLTFLGLHPLVICLALMAILTAFVFYGGFEGKNASGRSLSYNDQDVHPLSASHTHDPLFTPVHAIEDDDEILEALDLIRQNKIFPLSQIKGQSIYQLQGLYADYDYHFDLATMPDAPSIPRVSLSDIPNDAHELQDVDMRKSLFIQNMLPLILKANENIRVKRVMAMRLIEEKQNGNLSEQQYQWLQQFYSRYRVDIGDDEELLKRIDVIPVSLALAQAAIESAWGTSRFARQGNALFGQWTWSQTAPSIVPEGRDEGETYAIKAFKNPLQAVEAYMLNLNRHWAYEDLRDARAVLRQGNQKITSEPLIEGLVAYSEKGRDYLDIMNAVIQQNNLKRFDDAKLEPESPVIFPIISMAF